MSVSKLMFLHVEIHVSSSTSSLASFSFSFVNNARAGAPSNRIEWEKHIASELEKYSAMGVNLQRSASMQPRTSPAKLSSH